MGRPHLKDSSESSIHVAIAMNEFIVYIVVSGIVYIVVSGISGNIFLIIE